MSLLATAADFEQGGAGVMYNPPYSEFPDFAMRINSMKGRVAPNNQKLAIWGCAYGFLVKQAVAAGYDAYGFDASAYAISQGKSVNPSIAARLFQRDALVAADVTASRNDAGLKGNARFPLLVTEELFGCMSDAEINTSLPLLRGASTGNLLHIMTPQDGDGTPWDMRLNWKTKAQWLALLSPPDLCMNPLGVQF